VSVHEQRAALRVGAGKTRHHAGTAGSRLDDRRIESHLGQLGRDVLGRMAFAVASGGVAGIRGVDAQQVAADVDDLGGGVGRGLSHGVHVYQVPRSVYHAPRSVCQTQPSVCQAPRSRSRYHSW
jgi:hypothetical protein